MKKKIKYFFIIGYLLCIFVLIFESCLNGDDSSKQSDTLGYGLMDIVNSFSGDQTEFISLEDVSINNKINEGYVNDSYQLDVSLYPENSSNKSLKYQSSNEKIVSISPNGLIHFLDEGEAIISVFSSFDEKIFDSFSISVKHIDVEDFYVYLNEDLISDMNVLYLDHSYSLSIEYFPSNASNNCVSFETDSSSYLNINRMGFIMPLSYSNNEVTTITVKVGNICRKYEFIVEISDFVSVENVLSNNSCYDIYIGEVIKPEIIFYPSNVSIKEYFLSCDSDIVSISNNTIKGEKEGKAIINICSSVRSTFEVNVIDPGPISMFEVSSDVINLNIGSSKIIDILVISPCVYSPISSLSFSCEDPSIVNVDEGLITGLKKGSTKIYIKSSEFNKEIVINVNKYFGSDHLTTDLNIYLKDKYFYTNTKYEFDSLIDVSFYCGDELYNPVGSSLVYFLDGVKVSNLFVEKCGKHKLEIYHLESGISHDFEIIFLNDFLIPNYNLNEIIPLKCGSYVNFVIENNSDYLVSLSDSSLGILDGCSFRAYYKEGLVKISLIPLYHNEPVLSLETFLIFSIYSPILTSIDYEVIDLNNDDVLLFTNDELSFIKSDLVCLNTLGDEENIFHNFLITSFDEEILSVDNFGNLSFNKAGKTKILIYDEISKLNKEIVVNVYNVINLDENPFFIVGDNVSYLDDVYFLNNGKSYEIKMQFLDDSTYSYVNYKSSNEKIVFVGSDGVLVPHKSGEAVIYLEINDGFSEKIIYEFSLKIEGEKLINNISSFLYGIRKGIGHFGAFLIFGIFSSFVFLFFFKFKNKFLSIFICFVQGFVLALITEIIQLFVPGRYGVFSDVMIDFCGFCFSTLIISIIFLIKNKKISY